MHIVNHVPFALTYAVKSPSTGLIIASGTVKGREQTQVHGSDPEQRYQIELSFSNAPGRHVADDVHGDSIITVGVPDPAPVTNLLYDTSYSLFLTGAQQFVTWSLGFSVWAYLCGEQLSVWLEGGTGNVQTGDVVQIGASTYLGEKTWLTARGVGDWTVSWSSANLWPSTWNWSIWVDQAMTKGLPLLVGDTVYLMSEASGGWAGNFLMQELPNDPSYLTIGPASTSSPMIFMFLGGSSADRQPTRLPQDTSREPITPIVRIRRPMQTPTPQ